jgi:hypothetical protein
MNAIKETRQFRVNPRIVSNPEDIYKFDNSTLKFQHENRKESILIESFSGSEKTGYLLILPLFSKSRPKEKQAVFFSNITYSNSIEAKLLIREGLMCSWEMGYHVAFTSGKNSLYKDSGFQNFSKNFFRSFFPKISLLYSDLTWNGIKQVSRDLIFPIIVSS